jgi:hypothetical protein
MNRNLKIWKIGNLEIEFNRTVSLTINRQPAFAKAPAGKAANGHPPSLKLRRAKPPTTNR